MASGDTRHEPAYKKVETEFSSFTGSGFIPIEDLVDTVNVWRERKILCEDVDYLEKKGGKLQ